MQRRLGSFLAVFAITAGASRFAPDASASGGAEVGGRELSPREQAIHALNRLAFGPRPGDVDRVMRMGVDRWIDQQLYPERIHDHDVEGLLKSYPDLGRTASELLAKYPPPGAQLARKRLRGDSTLSRQDSVEIQRQLRSSRAFVGEVTSAKVARAVMSNRQLEEVMTDFWENHFNVFAGKGQVRYFIPDFDRDAIRPNALGHFRDLLGAVAKSPAMLFYLDNVQSVADSNAPTLARSRPGAFGGGGRRPARPGIGNRPGGRIGPGVITRPGIRRRLPPDIQDMIARGDTSDAVDQVNRALQLAQQRRPRGLNENYARELMELHTLGVDGGYTQQDVIEVARALTGWSIQPLRQGRAGFVFRPEAHDAGEKVVLGHHLPAGRGIQDGEEVLDILASSPATARYISRKLVVRFVSDDAPDGLVDRAAETFTRTNGDIREVLRTIFTSPEFFSRAAYRAKVKSPFEVTVSALRALDARPDTTPFTAGMVSRLGEQIFGHQAPNGWPETGEAWMNTGAILNRINFGLALASGRFPGVSLPSWPPYADLVHASHEAQVTGVTESLLGGEVSPETMEILRSGTNPLLGTASGDSAGADDPMPRAGMGGRGTRPDPGARGRAGGFGRVRPLTGLEQVIGLALGSPEFQRR